MKNTSESPTVSTPNIIGWGPSESGTLNETSIGSIALATANNARAGLTGESKSHDSQYKEQPRE